MVRVRARLGGSLYCEWCQINYRHKTKWLYISAGRDHRVGNDPQGASPFELQVNVVVPDDQLIDDRFQRYTRSC
jgi:hypothetical protein